ncbi:2Fe-2S iron-sulfur cluster binding domain-containing protein [Bacillus subtilis subsp. subtilis]|nr:2Fe-2S iron-sulfur cluster binding domain-containing protein [Bacillus subtilis subsp. subtilis]
MTMTHQVQIWSCGRPLAVAEGSAVLDAALAAGIAYPHGCRAGQCGSCLSRLLSGEVVLRPHSRFALSDAQKAQGLILACCAVPPAMVAAAMRLGRAAGLRAEDLHADVFFTPAAATAR